MSFAILKCCFLFFRSTSLYGLAEDLFVVREALKEAEENDENQLWIEYATMGIVAVGATASVWSCVRHSYDTRTTVGVSVLFLLSLPLPHVGDASLSRVDPGGDS